jgi:hypothetical protein
MITERSDMESQHSLKVRPDLERFSALQSSDPGEFKVVPLSDLKATWEKTTMNASPKTGIKED